MSAIMHMYLAANNHKIPGVIAGNPLSKGLYDVCKTPYQPYIVARYEKLFLHRKKKIN